MAAKRAQDHPGWSLGHLEADCKKRQPAPLPLTPAIRRHGRHHTWQARAGAGASTRDQDRFLNLSAAHGALVLLRLNVVSAGRTEADVAAGDADHALGRGPAHRALQLGAQVVVLAARRGGVGGDPKQIGAADHGRHGRRARLLILGQSGREAVPAGLLVLLLRQLIQPLSLRGWVGGRAA